MRNIYKFILFVLLSGTLFMSLTFFIPKEDNKPDIDLELKPNNNLENTTTKPEAIKPSGAVTVFLQENDRNKILTEDREILFISKSLQPTFVIKKNKEASNLKIYFDDSREDLLTSRFSNADINYENDSDIEIKFPYTIEPKKHQIAVKYNIDSKEVIKRYNFLLILFDDFSTTLNKSKFWGMAEKTFKNYNNWEIKNGRLIANSYKAPDGAISSLFFVRRFQGDFFVEFNLTPRSNNISFNTYLLERKLNFVFGNGNNKNITVLNKNIKGKFIFEPFKTYRIRLGREQNIYKIFIASNKDISNSLFDFSDNDLVLVYEDKEQLKVPYDAFGFTIWPKSGGVEIDNFYTANEDIDKYTNFYD